MRDLIGHLRASCPRLRVRLLLVGVLAAVTMAVMAPSGVTAQTGTVGGQNLELDVGRTDLGCPNPNCVALFWDGGTLQTSYTMIRIALFAGDVITFPGGPPDAAGFIDSAPVSNDINCYILLALQGTNTVLGVSDALCAFAGVQQGTIFPLGLSLFQTSTAHLFWLPPGGQAGYTMVSIPFSGSAPTAVSLPAAATDFQADTGGAFTCYLNMAMTSGGGVLGFPAPVCGIPGVASFPSITGAGQASVAGVVARVGARLGGITWGGRTSSPIRAGAVVTGNSGSFRRLTGASAQRLGSHAAHR